MKVLSPVESAATVKVALPELEANVRKELPEPLLPVLCIVKEVFASFVPSKVSDLTVGLKVPKNIPTLVVPPIMTSVVLATAGVVPVFQLPAIVQ